MKHFPRRRVFLLFLLGLFWTIWLFDRITTWPSIGPDEHLLAPSSDYPSTWGNSAHPVIVTSWSDSVPRTFDGLEHAIFTDKRFFEPTWFGRFWTVGVHQAPSNPNTPAFITQLMRQYDFPSEAIIKSRQLQPGDRSTWQSLHFTAPINVHTLVIPLAHSAIPNASERQLGCAVGPISACELWYAWIRYGQYLLQITVFTPNNGMDSTTFLSFITRVDTHVSQALKQEKP